MKAFIADLARPFAIISTSGAASVAIGKIAWEIKDGNAGAVFIAAVLAGVGALVGVRAWENVKGNQASADVEKVRAQQTPPPTEALKPADLPPPERSLEDPA